MGRLPFDPGKMKPASRAASTRAGGDAAARTKPDAISVSAFARLIERAVGKAFPQRVTVRGEVSGARHRTHFYFNLKDDDAVIGAVMFASAARRSSVKPTDGTTVLATGKLEYYAPSGRLSLIVDSIAEDGVGSLEARFRALCDDLRARGWFDPASKRTIASFPRRVAVLTASGSAALHDVLDTAAQRCPAVELVLIDVPVQGERAAPTIARTIESLDRNAHRLGIDAILLTRGGGSVEDLWCFNDQALAQAIHDCRVPLVAAIGHESDTTIAELVADHRSATPTQATVRLTPDRAALAQQLDSLDRRRARAIGHAIEIQRRRLEGLARTPVLADPTTIVSIQRDRVARAAERLDAVVRTRLQRSAARTHRLEVALERHRPHAALQRRRDELMRLRRELEAAGRSVLRAQDRSLAGYEGVLKAIDPTRVLERGYSITTREDGTVVREPTEAPSGTRLITRLANGSLASTVDGAPASPPRPESVPVPAPDAKPSAPARKPKPRKPSKPNPDQPGLFGGDA